MPGQTERRRFPTRWAIASAVALVVYVYSFGWVTHFREYKNIKQENFVLMHSGSIQVARVFNATPHARDLRIAEIQFYPGVQDDLWSVPDFFFSAKNFSFYVNVPLWLLVVPIWVITFIKWRRWRRLPAGACRKCGYDLRGLRDDAARCPECGAMVHPAGASERSP